MIEILREVIIPHIDTIGLVILGLYFAYERYRNGTNTLSKEIREDYKERNDQLSKRIDEYKAEQTAQGKEIAKLSGIIEEKDKYIESLTKIIQGRNPEIVDLLKTIKDLNEQVKDFMQQNLVALKGISDELDYQTDILDKTDERNKKVDQGHVEAALSQ